MYLRRKHTGIPPGIKIIVGKYTTWLLFCHAWSREEWAHYSGPIIRVTRLNAIVEFYFKRRLPKYFPIGARSVSSKVASPLSQTDISTAPTHYKANLHGGALLVLFFHLRDKKLRGCVWVCQKRWVSSLLFQQKDQGRSQQASKNQYVYRKESPGSPIIVQCLHQRLSGLLEPIGWMQSTKDKPADT